MPINYTDMNKNILCEEENPLKSSLKFFSYNAAKESLNTEFIWNCYLTKHFPLINLLLQKNARFCKISISND